MRTNWRFMLVIGSLLAAAGCGNNDAPPPPPPTIPGQPVMPGQPGVPGQPVMPGQPVVPGMPGQPVMPGMPGQPVMPGMPGQPAVPGQIQSNFGTVTLTPGFMPDPHVVQGTSGGNVQATTFNPECRGWVSQTPDHIFMAAAPFGNLRFLANGGTTDVTLVIQKPDGTYVCNDDAEGRNPIVQGPFTAGPHKIWIGSYNQGDNARYNLGISELANTTAAQLGDPMGGAVAPGAPAPGNLASNFGTVTLSPGFVPDPHVAQGRSGGVVQAGTWQPGCTGWVSQQADHILVAGGSFANLRVLVRARLDVTLVIQKPDGSYICNDDAEGRNPIVQGPFPPGAYKIWVGSYEQGRNADYHIGFSELSSVRARDVR